MVHCVHVCLPGRENLPSEVISSTSCFKFLLVSVTTVLGELAFDKQFRFSSALTWTPQNKALLCRLVIQRSRAWVMDPRGLAFRLL